MARPHATTPVETTVMIVRSLVDWANEYEGELRTVFGDDYDAATRATELADALEAAEENYVEEQREDVGLTNMNEDMLSRTRRMVTSVRALARIALADEDDVADMLNDFATAPPSRIRSTNNARKALTRLKAAMRIHGDRMAKRLANIDDVRARIAELAEHYDTVNARDASETTQTREARRLREDARLDAVEFVEHMQLSAEAMEFMKPDAIEALDAIFDTHNPARRPAVGDGDEEPVEPVVDPASDPTPSPVDAE